MPHVIWNAAEIARGAHHMVPPKTIPRGEGKAVRVVERSST